MQEKEDCWHFYALMYDLAYCWFCSMAEYTWFRDFSWLLWILMLRFLSFILIFKIIMLTRLRRNTQISTKPVFHCMYKQIHEDVGQWGNLVTLYGSNVVWSLKASSWSTRNSTGWSLCEARSMVATSDVNVWNTRTHQQLTQNNTITHTRNNKNQQASCIRQI